jgi:uncharacterized protein YkwD
LRRRLLLAAMLVAALFLRPEVGRTEGESTPRASWSISGPVTTDEQKFLDLINRERTSRRLPELKLDPTLVAVAREHSREMCDRDYFDHRSPTEGKRTPMERYLSALPKRPRYACVGENLFYCSVVDVERGHKALMNSPGHRANILFPRFRAAGVGIYVSESGEFWVTEMFLTNDG